MILSCFLFSESTQNTSRNYSFDSTSSKLGDLTDERSMHFSYDDLAMITDNFNVAREIGRGGFATVYYGERNGQVGGYTEASYLYVNCLQD